jgi:NADH-quinone oxidoreductase subunit C
MTNEDFLSRLRERYAEAVVETSEFRGEQSCVIAKDKIVEVCTFLRDDPNLRYDLLSDVCGIDMSTPVDRFGVIYNLFSIPNRHRIRLKIFTQEDDPTVPSVTGVWEAAGFYEREAYDMFGIVFQGHPDLRRIYMPEEYEHFPLRKDFPLLGIPGSLPLPKK